MPRFTPLAATSVLALSLGAPVALADVTAEEVWANLESSLTDFGYDVQAKTETSGDTLTVTDFSLTIDIPEDDGKATVQMGGMSLTNRGDGTVGLMLPASWPVTFTVMVEDETPVSGKLTYQSEGLEAVISGDPGDMVTDFSADKATIQLDEITAEGETIGSEAIRFVVGMDGLAGRAAMKTGELREFDQTGSVARVTYDVDIRPPEEEGRVVANGTLDNLSYAARGSIPTDADMTDMAAAVEAGFAVDASYSYGPTQVQFSFDDDASKVQGTAGAETGNFAMSMGRERLTYEAGGTNAMVELSGSDLPFPIALSLAETAFKLSVPVQPGDAPQDFELDLTLGGFEMSDMIWSLFDMQGVLPRDPATIDIGISGMAQLTTNLFEIEEDMAASGQPQVPGELRELNLDTLRVEAAGASLTGDGAFVIDNSDTTTFDGMPRPEGKLNLTLTGANALMDKLVQMGFLPQEQAMGARMMLGMFAVPGDGEDSLKSTLEVNAEGQVIANGQRLR